MEGNPIHTKHAVVVWDPKDDYWEGALVTAQNAEMIRGRGGCVLPAVPELFRLGGCGGFFKRAWGAGWPLDFAFPEISCPMTILVTEGFRGIYWAARLQLRNTEAPEGEEYRKVNGVLRLTSDTSQTHALKASCTPVGNVVQGAELGKPDDFGGWTVTGKVTIHPPQMGYHGFALYGTMPGVRVAWAALSIVPAVV